MPVQHRRSRMPLHRRSSSKRPKYAEYLGRMEPPGPRTHSPYYPPLNNPSYDFLHTHLSFHPIMPGMQFSTFYPAGVSSTDVPAGTAFATRQYSLGNFTKVPTIVSTYMNQPTNDIPKYLLDSMNPDERKRALEGVAKLNAEEDRIAARRNMRLFGTDFHTTDTYKVQDESILKREESIVLGDGKPKRPPTPKKAKSKTPPPKKPKSKTPPPKPKSKTPPPKPKPKTPPLKPKSKTPTKPKSKTPSKKPKSKTPSKKPKSKSKTSNKPKSIIALKKAKSKTPKKRKSRARSKISKARPRSQTPKPRPPPQKPTSRPPSQRSKSRPIARRSTSKPQKSQPKRMAAPKQKSKQAPMQKSKSRPQRRRERSRRSRKYDYSPTDSEDEEEGLCFEFRPVSPCAAEISITIEPDEDECPFEYAVNNGIMPIVCYTTPAYFGMPPNGAPNTMSHNSFGSTPSYY